MICICVYVYTFTWIHVTNTHIFRVQLEHIQPKIALRPLFEQLKTTVFSFEKSHCRDKEAEFKKNFKKALTSGIRCHDFRKVNTPKSTLVINCPVSTFPFVFLVLYAF